VKKNQPLLYAHVKNLPWKRVPSGSTNREDRARPATETRTLKAVHIDRLGIDFPHAHQAVKLTRWRQDTGTGKGPARDRLRHHQPDQRPGRPRGLPGSSVSTGRSRSEHHIRTSSFGEDHATSRPGTGPTNLATLRSAIKTALKSVGYLHIPEGRRDHTKVTETLYLHELI